MSKEIKVSKHKRTLKSGKKVKVRKHTRNIAESEQFDPISEDWIKEHQLEELEYIIKNVYPCYCPNCQKETIHELQVAKPGMERTICDQCMLVIDNPQVKVGDLQNIDNREFLFGDLDKDGIKNIDDKLPFKKSKHSVEETKLSDTLIQIDENYTIDKKKMENIVNEFQSIVAKKKGIKKKNVGKNTQHRVKTPISTLNKAYDRGIGEVHDKLGMRFIGKNYAELSEMRNEISKHYEVLYHKDFYKDIRPDGYKAIHLFVHDKKNDANVEIQLNSFRIRRLGDINHLLYKEKRQNMQEFARLNKIAESADNGNQKDAKYLDTLTDKQIENMLILGD